MIVKNTAYLACALLSVGCMAGSGTAGPPTPAPADRARTSMDISPLPPSGLSNIRYEAAFDSATAPRRIIQVAMRFTSAKAASVLLSLPAWTPGAYEISNYARFVDRFAAVAGNDSLDWDKTDHDTWRVSVRAPGEVTVRFEYKADSLDNAMSWSKDDFAFFNGTNLFLFPEPEEYG